jgi:hypothetical protein
VWLAGGTKLANPQAAFAFELEGADPWGLAVEPPPRLDSEQFDGEMTECYWLALTRDVPYSRSGEEPVTAAAVTDLRRLEGYRDAGQGPPHLQGVLQRGLGDPNPVVPSGDGLSLQPWKGEPLTVGGELNKLAFDMAFGRDTAGVHFRQDELEGVLLGEASAFSVIADVNTAYNEGFDGFRLTSFDGTTTTI